MTNGTIINLSNKDLEYINIIYLFSFTNFKDKHRCYLLNVISCEKVDFYGIYKHSEDLIQLRVLVKKTNS